MKNNNGRRGEIFNIQRYSIHDGPGIRTTVFIKGCPLKCRWCSNPESQNLFPELFFREKKCNKCGKCLAACSQAAIIMSKDDITIDRQRCDRCMKCVEACLPQAITCTGESKTVQEVIDEASKDEMFYWNSDGGVTLSGGEPLSQPEFALSLLKICKEKSFHTALDTCGYAPWPVLEKILDYTDLVLYDIKHINPAQHLAGTGFDNKLIIDNLKRTAEKKKRLWIRIPIIPGYNDSEEHMKDLADFLAHISVEKVSLLGFHEWGRNKYESLGRDYFFKELSPVKEDALHTLRNILDSYGLNVSIGY